MLSFSPTALFRKKIDTLAVPVCENEEIHSNTIVQQLTRQAKALQEFSGAVKEQITLYNPSGTKIHRCFLLGLGAKNKVKVETLRAFAGRAVKAAISAKCQHLAVAAPVAKSISMDPRTMLKAIMEGALLANHIFDKYKAEQKLKPLKKITLIIVGQAADKNANLIKQVESVCQAALLAREWVSTPSNDKTPQQFAKAITAEAKKSQLKVRVLNQEQLRKQKFGALLAVAAGSKHAPCLVEMIYAPPKTRKTIVLVGKGVTFDSGGINLKSAAGLNGMKTDMSGAAAVAATMLAVAQLKPKHQIIGITPLVENMPSGTATRPGDIITSYAGKTVEIGNTDAEGRLILIDALAYAIKKYKPDTLIDLATLTGACVVALGEGMAAVFSRDDDLALSITDSGKVTHERCWPMPLPPDYKELLKSDIADINNLPKTRYGGAITAALFLSEFTKGIHWAHIDIAGPASIKKATDYCGPGGTGFGVRLLCDWIEKL